MERDTAPISKTDPSQRSITHINTSSISSGWIRSQRREVFLLLPFPCVSLATRFLHYISVHEISKNWQNSSVFTKITVRSWNLVEFRGSSQDFVGFRGISWDFVEFSWGAKFCLVFSWKPPSLPSVCPVFFVGFRGISWNFVGFRGRDFQCMSVLWNEVVPKLIIIGSSVGLQFACFVAENRIRAILSFESVTRRLCPMRCRERPCTPVLVGLWERVPCMGMITFRSGWLVLGRNTQSCSRQGLV